jgi:pimeloyl-ACP methyl ester carboxylesterase
MKIGYFFTRSNKLKLMLTQPDIPEEDLFTITTPTLVLAGRHDVIKESHTKLIASSISGSVLKILPGESHTSYVLHNEKLYGIIKSFIEG